MVRATDAILRDRRMDGREINHRVTVDEVLSGRYAKDRDYRCVECDQAVRAHREGPDGIPPAHFEHLARNRTCSRSHKL